MRLQFVRVRAEPARDGVGAVVGSEVYNMTGATNWQAEEFRNDALGNVWYGKTSSQATGVDSARWGAFTMNGALASMAARACTGYPDENVDTLYQAVDLAGNVKTSGQLKHTCLGSGGVTLEVAARHFLRADNRLAVIQRYVVNASGYQDGTWEEYRYDAGHGSLRVEETIRQVELELAFASRHLGTRAPL